MATLAEQEDHAAALRACFAAQGKQLVGFERNLAGRQPGGNHMHLNFVGVDDAAAGATKAAFVAAAKRAGFEWEVEIPAAQASGAAGRAALQEAVGKGEFCAVVLPDGGKLVHAIGRGERHSMNFGREVLAGLLGEPDRANWQECKLERAEEEAKVAAFKELFKPFEGTKAAPPPAVAPASAPDSGSAAATTAD